MDEEILKQLADLAGSGDQEATFALQRAQAAKLRDRASQPINNNTGLGSLLQGIGQGIGRYRADTQDQAAQAGQAGLMERRNALVRSLQARPPKTPEEARVLSMALAGAGANPLAAMGKQYEDSAVAGEKANAAAMVDKRQRDLDKAYKGIALPDGRVMKLNSETGEWQMIGEPNAKPQSPMGAMARPPPHKDFPGPDGMPVDHVWNGATWVPTTITPGAALPPPHPGTGAPPAPDGTTPRPATKPKGLTEGERASLQADQKKLDDLQRLASTFKDEYAGKGLTGEFQVNLAQSLGDSSLPGANVPLASWWANFNKEINNIERKQQAGVAVTPLEAKLFTLSRTIRAGMPPASIRQEFNRLITEEKGRLSAHVKARQAEGYNPGSLGATAPDAAATRSDGKIRIKRGGQTGWILPGDIKPGDERL